MGDRGNRISLGLLGAGNFATQTLIPAIKLVRGVELIGVCAASGAHSRHAGEKFGFQYCVTDASELIADRTINTVVIATRHHLHAAQVSESLRCGKHVFCEKPLCLKEQELSEIVRSYAQSPEGTLLMVGFNRRFAPMAVRMAAFLREIDEPVAMHYRINAGALPQDHWVNDAEQGGGRILGEVCHFVDFLCFLAAAPLIQVQAQGLADGARDDGQNVVVSLQFANGSLGTISYLANGDRSYSKERIEVFGGGAVAVLDDFRKLELVRHGRKQTFRSRFQQDKGHRAGWEAFSQAIVFRHAAPIAFEEIVASTLASLRIAESRFLGQPVSLDVGGWLKTESSPSGCDA
jgi:predicted dehydrogenase